MNYQPNFNINQITPPTENVNSGNYQPEYSILVNTDGTPVQIPHIYYKIYSGFISQVSTDNPTLIEIQNDEAYALSVKRTDVGKYKILGLSNIAYCGCLISQPLDSIVNIKLDNQDLNDCFIEINTYRHNGSLIDDVLNNTYLELKFPI